MSLESVSTALLRRQLLTLDRADRDKLVNGVVAVAGIGGIGCPVVDILARNAVAHFRIADIDYYDYTNARQLYMTWQTVGKSKVEVACARIWDINPEAEIVTFPQGITPTSYREFCQGADAICNQVDQLSSIMILHYAADRWRIPLVSGSRKRWPERHVLSVKLYDYRRPEVHYDMFFGDVEQRWGVPHALITELLAQVRHERECYDLVQEINTRNQAFRQARMLQEIRQGRVDTISEKSREYLLQVADAYPKEFHKMAIAPEEAFMMGCLAGTAVKDVLLGRTCHGVEVNLYHWQTDTAYREPVAA